MTLILDPMPPGAQPMLRALFRANRGLTSRDIAWFGASGWSHVDIVLCDGTLLGARSDHVGGKSPGVQVRPAGYEIPERWQLLELPCSLQEHDAAFTWAAPQMGKPYDKVGILDFADGSIRNRDWTDPAMWWCSEFAAMFLIQSGKIPLEAEDDSCMVDPGTCAWAWRGAGARNGVWTPPSN